MITIVLASKNGEKYIDRAIESVLAQTEKDLELIVVSDGSTDDTAAKIRNWMQKDKRCRLIELQKNIGPGPARDMAIKEARGDYIALIDDDDWWIAKEKLTVQRNFLDENPDYALVGATTTHLVDENGTFLKYYRNPADDETIRRSILIFNRFIASSVMFRKKTYFEVGGFKDMSPIEDYYLWLQVGCVAKFANIEGADTAYTVRPGSISAIRKKDLYEMDIVTISAFKNRYPNAWLGLTKTYLQLALLRLKNLS